MGRKLKGPIRQFTCIYHWTSRMNRETSGLVDLLPLDLEGRGI